MIENELLQKNKEVEPSYTNYHTFYRFYQNLDKDLDYAALFKEFREGFGVDVCFARAFSVLNNYKEELENYNKSSRSIMIDKLDLNGNGTFVIGIRLGNFKSKQSANNYCLIDPSYINEWCSTFKDELDYSVEVIFDNPDNPELCFVRLDFPKISKYGNAERLLLTWVRYLYETPYNYCPVEALRLKRLDKYKEYSLINLFNVVSHCGYTYGKTSFWGDGHSICKGGGIYQSKYIKEYFESSTKRSVNEFCRSYRYTKEVCRNSIEFKDMYDAMDQKRFEVRLQTYEKAIEEFDKNNK